jgi:hypothetical protein
MIIIHAVHEHNSFYYLSKIFYISHHAVGSSGRILHNKEMIMRAYGHASVWRTYIGIGRARDRKSWYHQLRSWWTAHQAARHHARLATLTARWDAKREAVRALHADAAVDMVASTHACSTATALCTLAL